MERKLRRTMIGKVVSNKMDKTIVVAVETNVTHKLYGKDINLKHMMKIMLVKLETK